jgi:hypothetical protein
MRKNKPKPILPKETDMPLRMERLGVDPENHAEFKEALLTAARAAVDDFPNALEAVKDSLRCASPPQVLAAFASYSMQGSLTDNGDVKKALPDIQQFHGELFHALLLAIPFEEWGDQPVTPDILEAVFANVPKLSDVFFMQSILESKALLDDEGLAIQSLQQRIRMHSHAVRNWGYYDQVIKLCRELYAPLDEGMIAHHGFSATDLIDLLAALVSEFEARQEAHWTTFEKILKGLSPKQLAQRYFKYVPDLVGSAAEMLDALPHETTREQMIAMLMAHYDLRLLDAAMFEPSDVAAFSGKDLGLVSAVLEALSFEPGALIDAKPVYLFLENPVWDHPAVKLGDSYCIPMPQMAFSHIHRLMERLTNDAGLRDLRSDTRAAYLEQQLAALIRKTLPGADVLSNVKWKKGGQQFENDILVVIDRFVLIAEAKSHRLTPQGLRGAPDRLKRHAKDLLFDPSLQSARLEELIDAPRSGDTDAIKILRGIGLDFTNADRVVRVSVTLEDFSVFNASEAEFKKIGWVSSEHALAPSILISDLNCLAEILDNEVLFLHYLSERAHLQKEHQLLGDELDYLGLYLQSGFNLATIRDDQSELVVSGMSSSIDRYYQALEAGLTVPRPKMNLRPLFRKITDRISLVRAEGWTLLGFHLISSADPAEQQAVERNLKKLRRFVQKNYEDPHHASTLVVQSPEERKALVMFYLFPDALRDSHRQTMQRLASEALDDSGRGECAVFARCTDNWGQVFESALLMRRK